MGRKKLSTIADATISFRLENGEKEILLKKIKVLREKLNKKSSKDHYRITVNEIYLTALKIGLERLDLLDLPKRKRLETPRGQKP